MTKASYKAGSERLFLPEGRYRALVTKADIIPIQGIDKLVVDFSLPHPETGENVIHTEFIKMEAWVNLFSDLMDLAYGEWDKSGGELDTDDLIGLNGELNILHNPGTGKHEGRTFCNADRFYKIELPEPTEEPKKN